MSKQRVNRQARLEMCVKAKVETIQHMETTLFREAVAAVSVYDVVPIRVERSDCELITQKIESAGRKVKQGTNAGVGLTVVVTQVAFVISV